MKNKIEDLVLESIDEEHKVGVDRKISPILSRLEAEGLIEKRTENSFKLTRYGKFIRMMGFESHEKTTAFERKLPKYTLARTRFLTMLFSMLFALSISLLLILIWWNMENKDPVKLFSKITAFS